MKAKVSVVVGLVLSAMLFGCAEDKSASARDYVGHWVEVSSKESKPMTLDIKFDGKTVLVDEKKTLFGKDFESKVVGKPGADNSITFEHGVGNLSMTLMDDRLLYKGRVLVKSP